MASSFEKSVKGATKIKALPPKTKYIEHILIATHSGEAGVAEIFRALSSRLRDSTWTVVFKSLITVHLMIREGAPDVTLAYLGRHRNALATSTFTDVQTQGRNIRHYGNYLTQRAIAYRETKFDFVRGSEGRLEKLSVDKGILREAEILQHQIAALLKCDVLDNEPENEITITVFRMLVLDLLVLNKVYNEALINILGHFFEMSKPDAERAMEIYRVFTAQNNDVLQYLSVARQYELQTRVQIPKFKHAPVTLGKQLEEYLRDPDFEINRRQYLAEQEAKKGGRNRSNSAATKPFLTNKKDTSESRAAAGRAFPENSQQPSTSSQAMKKPDADLIDFFESIEAPRPVTAYLPQQQFGIQQQQQPQQFPQGGFNPQQAPFQAQNQFQQFNNGFIPQQAQQPPPPQQPLQQNFTGAGFGGYTSQQPQPYQPTGLSPIPQDSSVSSFPNFQTMQTGLQPQTTNPFRQSMMMANNNSTGYSTPITSPMDRQSTNPFAKSTNTNNFNNNNGHTSMPASAQPFSPPPEQQNQNQFSNFQAQNPAPLVPMQTGTNPFARNSTINGAGNGRPQTSAGIPAGASTNPFRQASFVNTATGSGWQNNGSKIGGGFDGLETVPVFPRPVQQQPWG